MSYRHLVFCIGFFAELCLAISSNAQFTTILNIPPNPPPVSVSSNTQINVLGGGVIGDDFNVGLGNGSVTNVEMNVSAGTVGQRLRVHSGSVANIAGGTVGTGIFAEGGNVNVSGGTILGRFDVNSDARVNISGGTIVHTTFGSLDANQGEVNISGGIIGEGIEVFSSSVVNISGGRFAQRFSQFGGIVNFFGGEFRLNGELIDGLDLVGDSKPMTIPPASILSGTLVDGSTFAISNLPIYHSDKFEGGELRLHRAAIPLLGPSTINVPASPAPNGVRGGQVLNVGAGGGIGEAFNVAPGGILNVAGGTVGPYLEAVNASVNLTAGTIGTLAAIHNSEVHVSGGNLGVLELANGSQATILGGTVGDTTIVSGSEVTILGGTLTEFLLVRPDGAATFRGGTLQNGAAVFTGGEIDIFGGKFNRALSIQDKGRANISGGSFVGGIQALTGSEVNIVGSGFALDGAPIEGLVPGMPFVVSNRNAKLSGIFSDGTSFQFQLGGSCSRGCPLGAVEPGAVLTITVSAVPEPSTLVLVAFILALAILHRKRCDCPTLF
jgi:hypothetical protein